MNDTASPRFWWVNQGTTYDEARQSGHIWAPKENKSGKQLYHWENVLKVKAGDFLFHYAGGKLRAVSRAKSDGYEAKNVLSGKEWADDGWRVDAGYCALAKPVPIAKVGGKLSALQMEKGPINKSGGVNQGYLYEIPESAARLLIETIGDDPALQESGVCQAIMAGASNAESLGTAGLVMERAGGLEPLTVTSDAGAVGISGLVSALMTDLEASAVRTQTTLALRLIAALLSKRFLILTGLAGSGKTKFAQAFARWITPDPGWADALDHSRGKCTNRYYTLIPVGADWTGNESILGYPDGLQSTSYVTKPALQLIQHALEPENSSVPHLLILDEMNLSHVERYFADLLSAIESGEEIPIYEGDERKVDGKVVPLRLRLPTNLFIIGTVNVDETTYMFSPKVLDRANVIEFRMEPNELAAFLASPGAPRLEELDGKGATFSRGFLKAATDMTIKMPTSIKAGFEQEMALFFNLLRQHNLEFGYRTAFEAARFIHFYKLLGGYPDENEDWFNQAMDAVIVQKFLPKLHGSRSKLEGLLWALEWVCGVERIERYGKDYGMQLDEAGRAEDEARFGPETVWDMLKAKHSEDPAKASRYPLSCDKVMRMWRMLVRDQFASFAEA